MHTNRMTVFIIVFFIILSIIVVWSNITDNKKREIVISEGIESTGCVINKNYTKGHSITYSITFDFMYRGKMVTAVNSMIDRESFNNAIIGMKYEIKYLPESPKRNAIIYIDKPIEHEYSNIPAERERIMNTYKIKRNKLERFDR